MGHFGFHLVPADAELLGRDRAERCHHTLAHFCLCNVNDHGVVGIDAQPVGEIRFSCNGRR